MDRFRLTWADFCRESRVWDELLCRAIRPIVKFTFLFDVDLFKCGQNMIQILQYYSP